MRESESGQNDHAQINGASYSPLVYHVHLVDASLL